MGDPMLARSSHATTLRQKFELEKRLQCEAVKNPPNMAASPSICGQKQRFGSRETENDEIVRNMSNLPSFLESGKATPDRALGFGVMDWARLQNWKYQNCKQGPVRGNKCSPSRFDVFSDEIPSHLATRSETKIKDCRIYGSCPPKFMESESAVDMGAYQKKSSSLKGKMKIQDEGLNGSSDFFGNGERNAKDSVGVDHRVSCENILSHVNNNTLRSYPLRMEHPSSASRLEERRSSVSSKNSHGTMSTSRLEEKRSSVSSKNSHVNTSTSAASKQRNMSPIRRFSFGLSSKSAACPTTMKRSESPVSRKSTADNPPISNRSQSSPLRRLLEPLFPSKAANSHVNDPKLKAKTKLDSRNCSDYSHVNNPAESTSRTQALFETAVKNGRQMFTFAVENDENILAATVTDLSSSGKDNDNRWIYSFFTIDEIKKPKAGLFSQTRKDKSHGYVSNIVAQMTVSNRSVSGRNTREFSLFRVDSNVRPGDEVAAIVVKFDEEEDDREVFGMTVILPGGNHGVSSRGKPPSPLIQRWRSGGVCDCGGWDLGCRLRTLTNQVQSGGRSSSSSGQFELFFQGDVINERRFFRFCVVKEGIYSVEYNSCLSNLEVFSSCISVVECRKSCERTESRTYVAKRVEDDRNSISFASFPPLSPVGRV